MEPLVTIASCVDALWARYAIFPRRGGGGEGRLRDEPKECLRRMLKLPQ